jgi:hypothetical protein
MIKPLPGNMIVKLEGRYKDTGLIVIPVRYKGAAQLVGRIEAVALRPQDTRTLGIELASGMRIIVSPLGGRYLSENTWVYPITIKRKDERGLKYIDSGVLAIVPDSVDMSASSLDIERCKYCGDVNGSKQNMLMVDGVCPRCGKNSFGMVPDNEITATDDEVEQFKRSNRLAV